MSKTSLFAAGLGLLLLSGCGKLGTTPGAVQQKSTIEIFTDTSAEVQNDELVNLYTRLNGLTGVTKVEFYRGDKLLGSDETAPYTWLDEVGSDEQYTYYAVAYAGNVKDYSKQLDVRPKLKPRLTALSGKLNSAESFTAPLVLQPWTGGAGQVTVKSGELSAGSGPLAADGTFSVPLSAPSAAALTPLTPANLVALSGLRDCTGDAAVITGKTNPVSNMLVAGVQVRSDRREGRAAPLQILPPTPVNAGGLQRQINYYNVGTLIYVTNAATVRGSLTCPYPDGAKTEVTFALYLGKGWNKFTQQYTINPAAPVLGKLAYSVDFPRTAEGEPWVMLPSDAFPLTPKN